MRFFWLTLLLAASTGLTGQEELKAYPRFEDERKTALLVVVDQYASEQWRPLPGARRNAESIERVLKEQGYSVSLLVGSAATREAIMVAASGIARTDPSQVVLFLSGHSIQSADKQYFVAYDTRPDSLPSTAVDVRSLSEELLRSPASRLIALIDACTSGTADASGNMKSLFDGLPTGTERLYVLSSSSLKVRDTEATSAFSDALVAGLSGEAWSPVGSVRFDDLAMYVGARVGSIASPPVDVNHSPTAFSPIISQPDEYAEVRVFYATDRARLAAGHFGQEYGHDRSSSDGLDFGECRVSIPRDHRIGELETASILTFWKRPGKNIELLKTAVLQPESFWMDLKEAIETTKGQQVLIFVHGYRTSFESAIRRTAQLAYDLQFPGPAIAYSWPSDDMPVVSLLRYTADESNVEWTTQHLHDFLDTVSNKFPNATIHVIAHSMGSRALVNAVQALKTTRKSAHFKEVVLAAPDIDSGVFNQLAKLMVKRVQRITLYANSNDEALKASHGVHGHSRAGESGPDLRTITGIDTIDASKIDTGLVGHSYFSDTRSVVSDIYNLICLADRGGTIHLRINKGT